jgi:CysZ protein
MAEPNAPYGPPPAALAPAAAPAPLPRFWRFSAGFKAPFKGLSFIMHKPQLYPWAMFPVVVALVLVIGLGTLSVIYLPAVIKLLLGTGTAWYEVAGVVALQVVAALTGLLLSLLLGLGLAQPLSGFALEKLVRAMEHELGAPDHPNVPWWRELLRSVAANFWALVPALPILAVLFIIDLFVPFSWLVTFPLKIIVTGIALTWDLLDYPFSVRGLRLSMRAEWMRTHFPAVLGFGVALALLFLIPCVQLLLLPAGTVGATWLVNYFDEVEGKKRLPVVASYGVPPGA